jgi:hypothetical protein
MFNPINLLNRVYTWFSEGISTKAKVIIALAGLFVILGMGYTAYRINDYFEHDPNACNACHVHDAQNKKWAHSEHKTVTCHECHHATKKEQMIQMYRFAFKGVKSVSPRQEYQPFAAPRPSLLYGADRMRKMPRIQYPRVHGRAALLRQMP